MELSVDLHAHSGASGGVGEIDLAQAAQTMALKGIRVFGTGDCLHDGWLAALEAAFRPAEEGLFRLDGAGEAGARFLLQTEIILTLPAPGGGRKGVHVVLFFPGFGAARTACRLLDRWGVKRRIGRPFIACESVDQVAERFFALWAVDDAIEVVPAHVLTPQGIYGSDRPVDRLAQVFGEAAERIRAVETGLSADPLILALLPELDGRTLISNSDGHSGALNRVGREYTTLEVAALSYSEILSAIRAGRVVRTAEFTPAEGRYFLTGHRAGKKGHEEAYCYFSPDTVPAGNRCPVCGKPLTVGVLQRALELSARQGAARTLEEVRPRQPYIRMIPLVEVIAAALGVRNASSKKVLALYRAIVTAAGGETVFWTLDDAEAASVLRAAAADRVAEAVFQVRRGEYTFEPLGYDGAYGELVLGRTGSWFGHAVVVGASPRQRLPLG